MSSAPKQHELFSDATSDVERAERFEAYKGSLNDTFKAATAGGQRYIHGEGFAKVDTQRSEKIEKLRELSKSLAGDSAAEIQATLNQMQADLVKEIDSGPATISLGNTALGQTQGFVPIDLEAPSKKLVPRETPLRNMLPRNNSGKGTGVSFRRVRGWSNSNSASGVGDMPSFFTSEQENSTYSGVPAIRRPNQISYATDVNTLAYVEQGLGSSVSWRAQYAGQGYEDIRQLASTALLYSTMQAEEKNLLYARGASSLGYSGVLAAPTFGTPASVAVATGAPALTAGTYYVFVTASSGGGETAPVDAEGATPIAVAAGHVLEIPVSTYGSGTLLFNVYLGTTSDAATATHYVGSFVPQVSYNGVAATGGLALYVSGTYSSSATVPTTADMSANAYGYDGLLSILTSVNGPSGANGQGTGYFSQFNGSQYAGSTSAGATGILAVGDYPFQQAFEALYGAATAPNVGNSGNAGYSGAASGSVYTQYLQPQGNAFGAKLLADPDVVMVDGIIRASLGQFLKQNSASSAYRIMLTEGGVNGERVGAVVNGIYNQVTGKPVDLVVEPYMPPGSSLILSKTLPVPDSEISNTFEVRNVQDYMMYEWAAMGMTWDASTYMFGTLVPYAPAWSGSIVGLQP